MQFHSIYTRELNDHHTPNCCYWQFTHLMYFDIMNNKFLFWCHYVFVHQKSLVSFSSSLSLCVVPLWSLHLMEHTAKGRETLPIIYFYLPWGLMLQHDTHRHTVIHYVFTKMYPDSPSPPFVPTEMLNSKVSKFVCCCCFFQLGRYALSYMLFTPLSSLTTDTKSNGKVRTHILVARGDAG